MYLHVSSSTCHYGGYPGLCIANIDCFSFRMRQPTNAAGKINASLLYIHVHVAMLECACMCVYRKYAGFTHTCMRVCENMFSKGRKWRYSA